MYNYHNNLLVGGREGRRNERPNTELKLWKTSTGNTERVIFDLLPLRAWHSPTTCPQRMPNPRRVYIVKLGIEGSSCPIPFPYSPPCPLMTNQYTYIVHFGQQRFVAVSRTANFKKRKDLHTLLSSVINFFRNPRGLIE